MDFKSGKSWLLGLGRGPAVTTRSSPLERNGKKVASRALGGIFSGG